MVTFTILTLTALIAANFTNIGTVMTVFGSTTNPLLTVTFPIMFYLELCRLKDGKTFTPQAFGLHSLNFVVLVLSILGLY